MGRLFSLLRHTPAGVPNAQLPTISRITSNRIRFLLWTRFSFRKLACGLMTLLSAFLLLTACPSSVECQAEYKQHPDDSFLTAEIKRLRFVEAELKPRKVLQFVKCNFLFSEADTPFAVTTDDQKLYFFRFVRGKYRVVLSYKLKTSLHCDYLFADPLFWDNEFGPMLVTRWSQGDNEALVLFARDGDKIVKVFEETGGHFKAEFVDVNNDGLSDILITPTDRLTGEPVPNGITKIYLQKKVNGVRRFVLAKRVPWKKRFH